MSRELSPQNCANLLWGFAKLRQPSAELLPVVAARLESGLLDECKPVEVSDLAYAAAVIWPARIRSHAYAHTHTHTLTLTLTHTRSHARTHTHTHTRARAHTHTHTHTHAHVSTHVSTKGHELRVDQVRAAW